jgi:hypothetical protein
MILAEILAKSAHKTATTKLAGAHNALRVRLEIQWLDAS